jgi:multiple sugar transport system ATP-binding protein
VVVNVTLDRVTKRFGSVVAVRDVSIRVGRGELVVILGPSGCGKTTTLRMIAGLERPDGGRIFFDDLDVTDVPANKRDVAMVFQSYAIWPHMTVYDNIALPLKLRKIREDEIKRRVREAAELLKIDHLLNRHPHQLSGGERQRVAVARAIAFSPKVLLMDEPLSNLDALLRLHARAEIKRLQRKLNMTTVYVTHDQIEAMVLADRIVVMDKGVVQQVGPPDEVYNKPANIFVAEFIGTPPMNLFKAKVEDEALVAGDLKLEIPEHSSKVFESLRGKTVVVGIRPEHIHLDEKLTDLDSVQLEGTIELVENLGSEEVVHVRVGDVLLKAKHPGRLATREGLVKMYINIRNLHVFDPEEGIRVM